ncbi:hypothetical protein K490DRAFT_33273 [Saccharata proteae CBS 121410]|uniref:Probable 26S proteasome regulatory subunit p27 n=1 Tax=Saccharata proteae CBS 121410 TaxID=1314787 RepID=A0A9P4I017_9PEZI|nr:hypothetical protein K490DRAFT_33273 [Saccharata proteae CBS 121410]
MDDLHTPAAATANGASSNGVAKKDMTLQELIAEKDRVEGEIMALADVLKSHGVNMNTGLTTFDGYPRDDIDIAQIRTTRARIIHLRNDHRALMARIETGLHEHHAALSRSNAAATAQAGTSSSSSTTAGSTSIRQVPFAKVNGVVPGSPAESAGLRAGDRVVGFGDVNWMNHEKLAKVADTVGRSEGRVVAVKVLREGEGEVVELQLRPRRDWGGRGLLGCHLLPL